MKIRLGNFNFAVVRLRLPVRVGLPVPFGGVVQFRSLQNAPWTGRLDEHAIIVAIVWRSLTVTGDCKTTERGGGGSASAESQPVLHSALRTQRAPMRAARPAHTPPPSANWSVHTWCTLCTPCAHCAHWRRASRGRFRHVVSVSLPDYLEQAACIARI